ncbi:CATRA system-associated protein [Streptomyces sp. NPDC006430]|uniref:CATRA system-associated protein n=1 Tax=Streptomyces sp. NPDC006430 TaxID=3154299 RepID=UPI0033A8E805
MSDWSDALEDAEFVLAALSERAVAEPAVWAGWESGLADLERALDGGDTNRLRRALYELEDSVASERMRMLGDPHSRTPAPPPLADRLDRLVARIRVAGPGGSDASGGPGACDADADADPARSADDDAA